MRLAISAAQGIAFALDIPVVPVSSLAALAMQAPDDGADVLAIIDARMGEVYAGVFRRSAHGIEFLGEETVGAVASLKVPTSHALDVIGSGWASYRDAIATVLPAPPHWSDGDRYPQAVDVLRIAAPIAKRGGGVAADQVLPVYLRDKVALTLAEQKR